MNPATFHGVGTHVVIALFTAGVPHPATKKTAFIDFKDDGYKVRQHIGLVDDGRAEDRRKHLMAVLTDGVPDDTHFVVRSEEHTSELQSRGHLVCRLLLEKKKKEGSIEARHSSAERKFTYVE